MLVWGNWKKPTDAIIVLIHWYHVVVVDPEETSGFLHTYEHMSVRYLCHRQLWRRAAGPFTVGKFMPSLACFLSAVVCR